MGNKIGRPAFEVSITEEKEQLCRVIRATTSSQSHVVRAKIALGAAQGMSHQEIVAYSGASSFTVFKWRKRFSLYGVSVLSDAPRIGTPRTHDDSKIAEIIQLTTTTEPEDATHWSTNSMARAAGVSQSTVSRIWRAFGLKPHLIEYYTISNDPNFTDKVRDVVGLYLNPQTLQLSYVWTRRPRSRR